MQNRYFTLRLLFQVQFYLLVFATLASHAQKFTIPVLPDTQNEVADRQEMFLSRFSWIVEMKDSLNIPIVLHVGDIVNYDNQHHWENAGKGFEILDKAGIPYALAVGNHDTEAVGKNSRGYAPGNINKNLRKTMKFNSCFPPERLTAQEGRYEENKSDNAFYTFKAIGLDWLVLSLEYCPRPGPVKWANKIISNHLNHNVIVLTHYHLNTNGDISEDNEYGDLSPMQVYDRLIRKHKNILMVLSGHYGNSSWRNDKGKKGNRIYQILQDYQLEDSGGAYLRLLEIDTEKSSISGKMYSPYYDKEKRDGSLIHFSKVNFIK